MFLFGKSASIGIKYCDKMVLVDFILSYGILCSCITLICNCNLCIDRFIYPLT